MKYFASDNYVGVHPTVTAAMAKADTGAAPSYGNDRWTAKACDLLKEEFGQDVRAHFVFTGTAANVLTLLCMTRSHQAIVCTNKAHINTDECGSPEAIIGSKLLTFPTQDGKLSISDLSSVLPQRAEVHQSYPKVVSIAQLTECSTCYSLAELKALGSWCKENDFYFFMDGARLANAAAYLNVPLKAMTRDVGVDAISFGGAKNGLMVGESVVFFNESLGHEFAYLQKQHMQLGSKMRFVAAQFVAYLENQLWLENARKANALAALFASLIGNCSACKIPYSVDGNAILVRMPKKALEHLLKTFYFYIMDPFDDPSFPNDWPLARFMTSFSTTEEEVKEFAKAICECERFV